MIVRHELARSVLFRTSPQLWSNCVSKLYINGTTRANINSMVLIQLSYWYAELSSLGLVHLFTCITNLVRKHVSGQFGLLKATPTKWTILLLAFGSRKKKKKKRGREQRDSSAQCRCSPLNFPLSIKTIMLPSFARKADLQLGAALNKNRRRKKKLARKQTHMDAKNNIQNYFIFIKQLCHTSEYYQFTNEK